VKFKQTRSKGFVYLYRRADDSAAQFIDIHRLQPRGI